MRNAVLKLLLVLAAVICRKPSAAAQVRDSAGVRIVSNPLLASVPIHPLFTGNVGWYIGGVQADPKDEFQGVNYYERVAVRLGSGQIVVSDVTSLRLYDRMGKLLKVVGRDGEGPSEFRVILGLCRFRGDSVLVFDEGQQRMSVLSPSGTIVRQFTPKGKPVNGLCFDDGAYLREGDIVQSSSRFFPVRGYLLESSTGQKIREFGPFVGGVSGTIARAISFAVRGDELYVGDAIEMAVRVYSRTGGLLRIIRTADRPREVSAADWRHAAEAKIPPSPGREAALKGLLTKEHLSIWPTYSRIMVDQVGRLWVRYDPLTLAVGDGGWAVFDANGVLSFRVSVPMKNAIYTMRIQSIANGEAVLSDRDTDGARRIWFIPIVLPGK